MREIFFPTFFPRVFGVQYFGQGFIGNLPIRDITAPYRATIMSIGERIYRDDTWLITESDFDFNRCAMIRTYSSHRTSTSKKEISLSVKEPSKIYVAYDEKGSSSVPPWLKRLFKRTGRRIKSNQGHEYQLYVLEMRQGRISLGGNALGVQRPGQNYFVIVENLRHYNDVIFRDVVDLTIDEIKYTSDQMIQMFSNGMLVHNIGTDPLHKLYLANNQFIQNGYSILNTLFFNGAVLTSQMESLNYHEVISGPVDTGTTTILKYLEVVDGELVEKEKEIPVIIPAQLQEFTTNQLVNSVSGKTFEELVEELNVGIVPFEPVVENFIPQPYTPDVGEATLPFEEQEPLTNPSIMIYGNDFLNQGHETTLFWKAFNSSRILFGKKEIDFKGWVTLKPKTTTSYTFTIEADEELFTTNYNIQVKTLNDPEKLELPKLTLHSNKKLVEPGETVTLTWTAEGITDLQLGGNDAPSNSGSIDVIINENTEFTLKGFNPNLAVEVKLLVRVTDIKYGC